MVQLTAQEAGSLLHVAPCQRLQPAAVFHHRRHGADLRRQADARPLRLRLRDMDTSELQGLPVGWLTASWEY